MTARLAPALAVVAALGGVPSWAATPGPADSTAAARALLPAPEARPSGALLGRGDVLFALGTVAVVAVTARHDEWIASESNESSSPGEGDLARTAQPLGNSAIVLPALAATWLVARVSGRTEAASAITRIGVSVCAAGAGALLIKEVVGRSRPDESPGDSDNLQPFSGHESFPSGHAAVAFSLATAINRESSWRGTPWITYPLATLVGWSRVHDQQHWASDVVAGAALGIWTAHKVEDVMNPTRHSSPRVHLEIRSLEGSPALALAAGD
jgi:membrane-associated phospholipid phosphatase